LRRRPDKLGMALSLRSPRSRANARRITQSLGACGRPARYLLHMLPDSFILLWLTTRGDVDTLTPLERSKRMSRVRCKNTKPEWRVRRLLWALGFRYRLHARDLAGRPDIVFTRLKKVVFIHGCFWHRHPKCGRMPKSRLEFWGPKLRENRARDLRNQRALKKLGWEYLVVWECQLKDLDALEFRIVDFLNTE
jgi:DNA mismatch endonuclease (patch repair protein)